MLETIRRVHAGKKHIPPEVAKVVVEQLGADALTHREAEVLQLITAGNRNQDVAQRLFISPETVKVHMKHAREKLGASGRAHAVAIAARRGFIDLLESR
jgi:DNA-binding NarL/FixJ family response regulator